MKRILTLLVLAIVPVLALTAHGISADKGSQLIFQSNMAHKNFISVANTADKMAVTVLVQYYNDEMKRVLWYLRVIPGGGTVLVDPFNHMIPGSDPAMNVSDVLDSLPAMSTDKNAGMNSGRFVIAVTAVGANLKGLPAGTERETPATGTAADHTNTEEEPRVNVLFPDFLAKGMHGTDNIDNGGKLTSGTNPSNEIPDGSTNVNDRYILVKHADSKKDNTDDDDTSKNVGGLTVGNAMPISFNHLTGHFTEALMGTAGGGSDQTASWGGTPVIRPSVLDTANTMANGDGGAIIDYQALNGMDAADDTAGDNVLGGRLAEKDAGGSEELIAHAVSGYTNAGGNRKDNNEDGTFDADEGVIQNTPASCTPDADTPVTTGCRMNRGLNMGALVLPTLHGGGEMAHQVMLLLSVADDMMGAAGKYQLIAAKTGYSVTLMDNMGDALPDPSADSAPVFGGVAAPEAPPGTKIIVDGIQVMVDAGKCGGTMIDGYWMLNNLTSLVPTASTGVKDFAGLDAMMTPGMNDSPGWIKFMRAGLECEKDYGDGDAATGSTIEDDDGVPTSSKRTYKAGTLVVEEATMDRSFVTTGQALLKFITPSSTFGASWSLKSPSSPAN